jgi:hypothetical protein
MASVLGKGTQGANWGYGSLDSTDIVLKTTMALRNKYARETLLGNSMEAPTLMFFMRNLIVSPSKEYAIAQYYNYAKLQPTDNAGNIVSRSKLKSASTKFAMSKLASALDVPDMDAKAMMKAGTMGDILYGIESVNFQSIMDMCSYTLRNLHTGVLKAYNETPVILNRATGSLFLKDGVNLVPNMIAVELSAEGIKQAKQKFNSHKDLDGSNKDSGNQYLLIVDRRNLQNAIDILSEMYKGDSNNPNIQYRGLTLGVADLDDERDWCLVTDKAQFGFAVWSETILPTISIWTEEENEEVHYVSKWYVEPYCLSPYGIVFSKF